MEAASFQRQSAVTAVFRKPDPYVVRHRFVSNAVRQIFGMKVRMVGEDPDMPEFVGDNGMQIVLIEHIQKGLFKRYLKDPSALEGLNGNDQCIIRNDNGKDFLWNSQLLFQLVDDLFDFLCCFVRSAAVSVRLEE